MPVVDLAEELRQLEAFVAQVRHETNSDAAKQDHRDIYSRLGALICRRYL